MCPNHTGPQREEKDTRRGWPSAILGTAYSNGNGWYVDETGHTPNFDLKLQEYRKRMEEKNKGGANVDRS